MIPYEHQAKYYETDQMGIIHHSNYIRWMEEARIDFMDQMGFSYRAMEEAGISSAVVGVTCKYLGMVQFDDRILITVRITQYNGVKMELTYSMVDKKTGEVRTTGTSSHCFLASDGKIVNLRKACRELHDRFLEVQQEAEAAEAAAAIK